MLLTYRSLYEASAAAATGTGAATLSFSAVISGKVGNVGAASAGLAFNASAIGVQARKGIAAATFSFAGVVSGRIGVVGAASAGVPLTAAATGAQVRTGAAAATFSFASVVSGGIGAVGAASAGVSFAAASTGAWEPFAHIGTGSASLSGPQGTASGVIGYTGAAAAVAGFLAPASGLHGTAGSAVAALAFTASATGESEVPAGTFTGTGAASIAFDAAATGTFTEAEFPPVVVITGGGRVVYVEPYVGAGAARLSLTASGQGIHGVAGSAAVAFQPAASATGEHVQPRTGEARAVVLDFVTQARGEADTWSEQDLMLIYAQAA